MRAGPIMDHRGELVIAAFAALALMLLIAGGATGVQWLSGRWNTACRHLVHAPEPPRFSRPWRLAPSTSESKPWTSPTSSCR